MLDEREHLLDRIRQLEASNAHLVRLANTDSLTGVDNHRYFQEQLVIEVERSLRTGVPVGLLMVDVDHFRDVNNRLGHQAGDEVLRKVAVALCAGRRRIDVVARYGGDEFAVILAAADLRAAAQVAEVVRGQVQGVTISIGVASCPASASSPDTLLAAADAALRAAKEAGRNRVRVQGRMS